MVYVVDYPFDISYYVGARMVALVVLCAFLNILTNSW